MMFTRKLHDSLPLSFLAAVAGIHALSSLNNFADILANIEKRMDFEESPIFRSRSISTDRYPSDEVSSHSNADVDGILGIYISESRSERAKKDCVEDKKKKTVKKPFFYDLLMSRNSCSKDGYEREPSFEFNGVIVFDGVIKDIVNPELNFGVWTFAEAEEYIKKADFSYANFDELIGFFYNLDAYIKLKENSSFSLDFINWLLRKYCLFLKKLVCSENCEKNISPDNSEEAVFVDIASLFRDIGQEGDVSSISITDSHAEKLLRAVIKSGPLLDVFRSFISAVCNIVDESMTAEIIKNYGEYTVRQSYHELLKALLEKLCLDITTYVNQKATFFCKGSTFIILDLPVAYTKSENDDEPTNARFYISTVRSFMRDKPIRALKLAYYSY